MEGLDLVSVGVDSELESVESDGVGLVGQLQLHANCLVYGFVGLYQHTGEVVQVDQRNSKHSFSVSGTVRLRNVVVGVECYVGHTVLRPQQPHL